MREKGEIERTARKALLLGELLLTISTGWLVANISRVAHGYTTPLEASFVATLFVIGLILTVLFFDSR